MKSSAGHDQTHLSQRILILIILVVLVTAASLLMKKPAADTTTDHPVQLPTLSLQPTAEPAIRTEPSNSAISPDEKAQIDIWIEKNDLNFYGDPKDTAYAGGTPLFDESTGTYIDRYEYIMNNHPDHPWKQ